MTTVWRIEVNYIGSGDYIIDMNANDIPEFFQNLELDGVHTVKIYQVL